MIAGKDKGKKAKVVRILTGKNKVVVEGINILKKHQKARKGGEKGQTIEMAMPISASNVMLLDPKSGKQSRTGSKVVSGKKIRVARKSDQEV